jgi:hypothetical protein
MSDVIDRACEVEQQLREVAIQNQKNSVSGPKYTGFCLYCEEEVSEPHRWCSISCRDMYEHEQKLKRHQGLS